MKTLFVALAVIFVTGCNDQTAAVTKNKHSDSNTAKHSEINETPASTIAGDAATIMSRKQVPILCYHHIKDVPVLPKNSIGYTVTYQTFKNHMKALADSGYHTVLPDQL